MMHKPPISVVPFPLPPLISTGTPPKKISAEANSAAEYSEDNASSSSKGAPPKVDNSRGGRNDENGNGLLNIETPSKPEKMIGDASSIDKSFSALDSGVKGNKEESSRLNEAIRKARKIAASMSASSMYVDEIIKVLEREEKELYQGDQQSEDDGSKRTEETEVHGGKKKESRVRMSSVEYVDSIINILENEDDQERGGGGGGKHCSNHDDWDEINKITTVDQIDEESCPFEFELLLPPKENISVLLQSSNKNKSNNKKKNRSANKGRNRHDNSTTRSSKYDNKSIHNCQYVLPNNNSNSNNSNSNSSKSDICNPNYKQQQPKSFGKVGYKLSSRNRQRVHGIGTKVVHTIASKTPKQYFQFEGYIDNQQCETCDVPCVIS
mmetsp:Transcript_25855/g.41582  ORF Transcript_25855/g.41582 Transcript_25855/m.41582 type:complete len:381 (+) Transcript_25855:491-1633(+)